MDHGPIKKARVETGPGTKLAQTLREGAMTVSREEVPPFHDVLQGLENNCVGEPTLHGLTILGLVAEICGQGTFTHDYILGGKPWCEWVTCHRKHQRHTQYWPCHWWPAGFVIVCILAAANIPITAENIYTGLFVLYRLIWAHGGKTMLYHLRFDHIHDVMQFLGKFVLGTELDVLEHRCYRAIQMITLLRKNIDQAAIEGVLWALKMDFGRMDRGLVQFFCVDGFPIKRMCAALKQRDIV